MIFGRRAFFGYAVAPGGEVWWFVNEPRRSAPTAATASPLSDADTDAGGLRRHLVRLLELDRGPGAGIVAATRQFAPSGPIHTLAHLPRWHSRRMLVLGDAAHAPSPSSGQGASLAIEDAAVLARALATATDEESALSQVVDQRRRRVERVIAQAERVNSSKAATGLARAARDLVLPLVLRATARSSALRETYDHVVSLP